MASTRGMYGRPHERRKRRAFYPGIRCHICGQPVTRYAEFTLHHTAGIEGGRYGPTVPAHRSCNLAEAGRKTTAKHGGWGEHRSARRVWHGAL
jgi:hypothetical protein